jgi:hypothetical protein
MRLIRLKTAHCGLQKGGDGGLGQVHRGRFYLLFDSPDGMRLIRLKAAHCGLQEGGMEAWGRCTEASFTFCSTHLTG